jgi:PAS domain S-box-containing protein
VHRRRFGWPLVAIAGLAVAALATTADFSKRLEYGFADSAAAILMAEIDTDVVIVGIDAESLAALDEWPWPRRHHASLIERIAPARPARLFIDIDFSSSSNAVDDAALQAALAAWPGPPVILPAFYQYASPASGELMLTKPSDRFLPYVSLASVTLRPSVDGLVRSVPPATEIDAPAPAPLAELLSGDYRTDEGGILLDFTIAPSSFRYVSYSDVLANDVPAATFAGRTVFVGAIALELNDMIPVPVHQSLPGVVVQAMAYESARRGGHQELLPAVYWPLVAAWAAILGFLFCRQSWRRNLVALGLALAIVAGAALSAYAFRTIVPTVPLVIVTLAAWLLATLRSLESETLRALAYAMGLRRRGALLQSIVLSSSDSIICIDGAGMIKTANPAAATLFRREPADLPGRSILELVPSLSALPVADSTSRFAGLAGSVREGSGRSADGSRFPVELSFSRVRLRDERLYTAIIRRQQPPLAQADVREQGQGRQDRPDVRALRRLQEGPGPHGQPLGRVGRR